MQVTELAAPVYEDNAAGVAWTAAKPLAGGTGAYSVASGMAASAVLVAVAGKRLYGVWYDNGNAAARFVQVHDSVSAPADGAVPIFSLPSEGTADRHPVFLDLRPFGVHMVNGIYVCHSSTAATKTLAGTDAQITVLYV